MRRRRPLGRGARRGVTVLVVAALALGGPLLAQPRPALARPALAQSRSAEVVIDRLTPQIPVRGATLTLSGHVLNRGSEALDGVTVGLRVSPQPLLTREEIAPSAKPDGPHPGRLEPAAVRKLDGTVKPGGSVPWSLSVPVDALKLNARGVYPIGVEARIGGTRLGITKTFLPWVPDRTGVIPTKLVMFWPLVDRPRLDANGVAIDDTLVRDLAPTGRLGRLLAAGASGQVTWVVDPDLLLTVSDMADGYEVATRQGRRQGSGRAAASLWLKNMRAATAGDELLALPYADPDVMALAHTGLSSDVGLASAEGADDLVDLLGRRPRTDVAWPPGNQVDSRGLSVLRRTGATAVVVDSAALPLRQETTFTPTSRTSLRVDGRPMDGLLADAAVTRLLSADMRRQGTAVLAGQQFLAETAMITEEHPNDPRVILLTPPRRWNPDPRLLDVVTTALRQAPWLAPGTLADLQRTPPPALRRQPLAYPETARADELAPVYLRQVGALHRRLRRYQNILTQPDAVGRAYTPAILRAESSAWRYSGLSGYVYAANVGRSLDTLERQVRIISQSTVTLSSKVGKIPITVANTSPQEVTVGLRMTSAVSRRLSLEPVQERVIGPQHKVTFEVPAKAVANGIVMVTAQLETPSGQPYGDQLTLKVRATNYSRVGLFVVGGSVGLLFMIVAVRLFRRARTALRKGRGSKNMTVVGT